MPSPSNIGGSPPIGITHHKRKTSPNRSRSPHRPTSPSRVIATPPVPKLPTRSVGDARVDPDVINKMFSQFSSPRMDKLYQQAHPSRTHRDIHTPSSALHLSANLLEDMGMSRQDMLDDSPPPRKIPTREAYRKLESAQRQCVFRSVSKRFASPTLEDEALGPGTYPRNYACVDPRIKNGRFLRDVRTSPARSQYVASDPGRYDTSFLNLSYGIPKEKPFVGMRQSMPRFGVSEMAYSFPDDLNTMTFYRRRYGHFLGTAPPADRPMTHKPMSRGHVDLREESRELVRSLRF